ncbi:hypothetical protein LAZ67_8000994 [Cordylochernes scorpioides]|uniref:Uncharacterized protein n=1 Tax=Cordylochernes scorpioides TaxID=51811 RepID=A0ABY6KPU4_9ARAC|nr:hypothetical protein LAZ67_8000994 [Cordylochernes scorpioides]
MDPFLKELYIRLVHNPKYHKRTKYIDISYHFIRDQFQNHAIYLFYVCTNAQAADIFTKALPPEKFIKQRSQLGLFETTKCLLVATHQPQHRKGKQEQNRRQKLVEPSGIFHEEHRRQRSYHVVGHTLAASRGRRLRHGTSDAQTGALLRARTGTGRQPLADSEGSTSHPV